MVTILFMVSVVSLLWGSPTCACGRFQTDYVYFDSDKFSCFDSTLSALEITRDDISNLCFFIRHIMSLYDINQYLPNRNQKQQDLYIKQPENELLTPMEICEYSAYIKDTSAERSKDSYSRVIAIKEEPLKIQIGSGMSALVAMIVYDSSNDSSPIVDLKTMEIRARLLFKLFHKNEIRLAHVIYKWADPLEKELRLSKNENLIPGGIIKNSLVPILMKICNECLKETDKANFKLCMRDLSISEQKSYYELKYIWSLIIHRFTSAHRFCLVGGEWQKKSVEIDEERMLEPWIEFAIKIPNFVQIAPHLLEFADNLKHDKIDHSKIKYVAKFMEKEKVIRDEIDKTKRNERRQCILMMHNKPGMSDSTNQLIDIFDMHIKPFLYRRYS